MVNVIRKKIHQLGGAYAIIIPKDWMDKNNLKLGSEIEIVVNADYILIKDCRNPFLRDLLAQEIESLYYLSNARKLKAEEVKKEFDADMKAMDDGTFKGQSIDTQPPFEKEMQNDISKANARYEKQKLDKKEKKPE